MKIFVFGNTGSGKSTLIEELNKQLNYQVISIDDFRKKYGNRSWTGDAEAIRQFHNNISITGKDQIIECSGIGTSGKFVKSVMPRIDDRILVVMMNTHPDKCILRNQFKLWSELNMPELKIEKIIRNIKNYEQVKILRAHYSRYAALLLSGDSEACIKPNIELIINRIQ